MAEDQTPPQPAAPAEAPAALDTVSLSEFVARRAKGETATAQPQTPPAEIPPDEVPEEETPLEAPAPGDETKKPPQPQPPKPPKSRFEERLGTLTRQRHEAERALEAERARAARLEAELQQIRQPKEPESPPEPVPDGQPPNLDRYLAAGKTYEDWTNANTQYLIAQAIQRERQQAAIEAQQRQFQADLDQYPARIEAAQQKYTDFQDVVLANERVQLSPVMQAIALRSPHGADIMYWLGTHEAEANQIGEMTRQYPVRPDSYALVEQHLLLLSGHSSNGQAGAKKAVPVSQAPAPITPVGGGTTTQPVSLDQAPLGEYIKRRNADVKKRTG